VVEPAFVPVEEVGGRGHVGTPVPVAVTDEDVPGERAGHRDDAHVGAAHLDDVEEEAAFVRPRVCDAEASWCPGFSTRIHDQQGTLLQRNEAVERRRARAADV
jgi:hypothetical protein